MKQILSKKQNDAGSDSIEKGNLRFHERNLDSLFTAQ